MKKKVLIVIYIILILITLKMLFNILINNILISNFKNGIYRENEAKKLTFFNFSQKYVADYNYGNILYKNGDYDRAIEKYRKSLNEFVPKNKECNIRINYALAICKTVTVNEKDKSSIDNAIKKYKAAIEVLTETGCANKDNNNGHNKNAEQLKSDIQNEIDKLEKLFNKEDENNNGEDNVENETKEDIATVEEKIQDIKENAISNQRELENKFKNFDKFDYNKVEKNW